MSHVLEAPLVECVLPEAFPLLHDLDTEGGCLLAHFIPIRCQMQCLTPVAPPIEPQQMTQWGPDYYMS